MNIRIIILLLYFLLPSVLFASGDDFPLDKAPIDPYDNKSIERGAQTFMTNCKGCHSLKYMRYKELAEGIGLVDSDGEVLSGFIKENWIFDGKNINSPITQSLMNEDALKWFGIIPPDLSLSSRYRGVDWIYTYLRSFYQDDSRPWGVNNKVYPSVNMPHVLSWMQGQSQYDVVVADLVNFLSYVGEPVQNQRKEIGKWVLAFLSIFAVFAYLLKREYWKDIK